MQRLTRHTASEVVAPAVGTLVVTTFLLLTTQILRIGEAAFGYGLTALDFGLILALLLPRFFVFTLPIAVLVGVTGGLGRLAADREILAMEAAGLSPLRLWPGPLLLGAVATAITFWLTTWGEPHALAALSERLGSVVERNLSQGITPGVVHEEIPGLVLHAGGRGEDGTLTEVLVHLEQEGTQATVTAARARLEPAGEAGLALRLQDGELVRAEGHRSPPVLTRARFEDGALGMDVSRTVSRRVRFIGRLDVMDQSALTAFAEETSDAGAARKARVQLWRRWTVPFACLGFALLGMPLGLAGSNRRQGGTSFAFVAGLAVVLADYLVTRLAEGAALSGRLSPPLALWLPNLALFALGAFFLWRRHRR